MLLLGKVEARVLWYSRRPGQVATGHAPVCPDSWAEAFSPQPGGVAGESANKELLAVGLRCLESPVGLQMSTAHRIRGPHAPLRRELRPRGGPNEGSGSDLCLPDQCSPLHISQPLHSYFIFFSFYFMVTELSFCAYKTYTGFSIPQ